MTCLLLMSDFNFSKLAWWFVLVLAIAKCLVVQIHDADRVLLKLIDKF